MTELPHAVLSDAIGDRLTNRRLVSAVFLTFRFDPGFFEQEILPVFFDVPFSHATTVRLLQLEDIFRSRRGQVAVYYDNNGLEQTNYGSARLDVRRIPIHHRNGIFHSKNIFALVEAKEPDENNQRPQTLLVASLSANLTRPGWWENTEACHIEEIAAGEKTRLRDDLLEFFGGVKTRSRAEKEHAALNEIIHFLKDETEPRAQRSSDGMLHTHFYYGKEPLVDFLENVAGAELRNKNLEIVSPYFDDAEDSKPLQTLIDRFSPRAVQIFLPCGDKGEVLCNEEIYNSIRNMENVSWAALPSSITRMGKAEEAANRFVHAKVYRFFSVHPKREIIFIGSANLTNAAFTGTRNMETGFLVDSIPPRKPDFWMIPEGKGRHSFEPKKEDEGRAASGGTRLQMRYRWDTKVAEVYWDDNQVSPALEIKAQNESLCKIDEIRSREWVKLEHDVAQHLERILGGTSLLTVHGEGAEPGVLLVQEEGMTHRPSLLHDLSAADILRSWAMLSPEQRAAFIEGHAEDLIQLGSVGAELVATVQLKAKHDSMFDRFAGFFHAFACLEKSILEAQKEEDERRATYLLFGKKYDSLGTLLQRVIDGKGSHDVVERYVIICCAQQLVKEVRKVWPDLWNAHIADGKELLGMFESAKAIRDALVQENPEEMEPFLDFFDKWFLRKAAARTPKEGEA